MNPFTGYRHQIRRLERQYRSPCNRYWRINLARVLPLAVIQAWTLPSKIIAGSAKHQRPLPFSPLYRLRNWSV